jgi:Tfp pilus assembly protein PilF
MKPMIRLTLAGLVAASLGLHATPAHAQRGGGGRPSSGLRGGGSFVPQSSSFNRTPSFTQRAAPPPQRFAAPTGFQPQTRPAAPVQQPAVARPAPSPPVAARVESPPARMSRPGSNNHQAWVHGYWHGRHDNHGFWNNGGAISTGMVVGWGLNPAVYNWGYRSFVNPFVVAPARTGFDLSQPLQSVAPQADPAGQAMLTFDAARASFKAGLHESALEKTEQVLQTMPNDAAVHEFRALCLFALQRYDQAAEALYTVLSAGPGWDWTTMIGLYPNVDVYSAQLRALEEYRTANPNSAAARFVLGYHYLTEGFEESAVGQFNRVIELKPNDSLSRMIVANLTGEARPEQARPAAAAVDVSSLIGTWNASPDADTTIVLTLQADGRFIWNVTQQGGARPLAGIYSFEGDVLTLVRDDDQNDAMVGRVTWKDASRFVFQALGGGADDPGLEFTK